MIARRERWILTSGLVAGMDCVILQTLLLMMMTTVTVIVVVDVVVVAVSAVVVVVDDAAVDVGEIGVGELSKSAAEGVAENV